MREDSRPAPEWAGVVHAGVDAWTQGPQRQQGRSDRSEAEDRLDQPVAGGRRRRRESGEARARRKPARDQAVVVPEADAESVARTILLDQLTGRARSRHELAEKLAAKEVPDDVAVRLLDRFTEIGLIDDEAFARTWVSERGAGGTGRGLARRALAEELRRKGVDPQVSGPVLDEVEPAAEEEMARLLVRKKLRSLTRVDDATATRRLLGLLARKGYPPSICCVVVREELRDADRTDPSL